MGLKRCPGRVIRACYPAPGAPPAVSCAGAWSP
jgi:hypothetical protein